MIEFDEAKNQANIRKRGVPLSDAELLFETKVLEWIDHRTTHEQRIIAFGVIENRVHVCVHTWRDEVRRVISLRKANRREVNAYR